MPVKEPAFSDPFDYLAHALERVDRWRFTSDPHAEEFKSEEAAVRAFGISYLSNAMPTTSELSIAVRGENERLVPLDHEKLAGWILDQEPFLRKLFDILAECRDPLRPMRLNDGEEEVDLGAEPQADGLLGRATAHCPECGAELGKAPHLKNCPLLRDQEASS